ncbi:MAG TPA: insulinase family protein [Candidatus Baltobacteraceae bacterium]|nr:insulinase family protein [Candidatus Baltobacteraceae bacterium]
MIAAIVLAAAAAAGPLQSSGTLPLGGQYIVHKDPSAATTAIDLWYRVPSSGYAAATPGVARVAIAALAASAPQNGTSFADLVKRDGGTLSINVYPDIAMIGASVPSWEAPAVLRAMTTAFFSPAITDAGFHAALRDTAIAAAEQQYSADATLQNALFARIFSGGPAHYAAVPATAADVTKITLDAVRSFAARGFRQQNAVLSIAGSADDKLLAGVRTSAGSQGNSQDAPLDSTLSNTPVDAIVNGPVAGLGIAFPGPPIADEKAATAMDFLADYLFDPQYGAINAIVSKKSDVSIGGQFITLHDPGVLVGTLSGSGAPALRPKVLEAVAALTKPMDAKSFEAARNAFLYRILSESQTPAGRADNAGWYAVEGNAQYAPGDESKRYVEIARSLDPSYVASIAAKYLQHPAIVQLLTAPKSGSAT